MTPSAIKDTIHRNIVKYYPAVQEWFQKKSQGLVFPFYSSFDLRDSSTKITPVDANLFPAGFNNICEVDKDGVPNFIHRYLNRHYPSARRLCLLAEEHTHNSFYWENVYTLKTAIEKSFLKNLKTPGCTLEVCVPGKNILQAMELTTARGNRLKVFPLKDKKSFDLVISNNDFSSDYDLKIANPVIPPLSAGWRYRKKHIFFENYNALAGEFAELIRMPKSALSIKTRRFQDFDIHSEGSLKRLKKEVDNFLKQLAPEYKNQTPFVFLKNNSGTYGSRHDHYSFCRGYGSLEL